MEKTTDPSPRDVVSAIHKTETNSVDESDGFKAARSDEEEEPDQHRPSLDETTEREIEARQQAHRLGLATRHLNQAIERHGTSPVVQAVAHVWQQREKGRVRNPGGLLASLLRRPQGRLTPEGLHAARPWRLPLAAEEARAMAAELAPSHNPHWLWQRFERLPPAMRGRAARRAPCLCRFRPQVPARSGTAWVLELSNAGPLAQGPEQVIQLAPLARGQGLRPVMPAARPKLPHLDLTEGTALDEREPVIASPFGTALGRRRLVHDRHAAAGPLSCAGSRAHGARPAPQRSPALA